MNSQFLPSSISRGVSLFFVTVCLINISWDASAHPLEHWHWRIPETPARNLNSVTFGQDRFVAVGNAGTILTSVDGLSWQTIESDAFEHLRGVSFLQDQFVAVGELGAVFVSTNGFDWSRRETGHFYDLNAIAHGNGLYVAVGDGGVIMTSTNLTSWDVRVLGAEPLRGVAYGNGQFIAVGGTMQSANDVAGFILASPDGITWSSRNARGIHSLHGVSFVNEMFLASGGIDWYPGFGADRSSPTLLSSLDGNEWIIRTWTSAGYYDELQSDAAFGNGNYLVAGRGLDGGPLSLSSDLNKWNSVMQIVGLAWLDVAFGNGRFVGVAAGGVIGVVLDENRTTIVRRSSFGFAANPFIDVEFGLGRFVALESAEYPNQIASTVFVSTNGVTWEEHAVIPRLPPVSAGVGIVTFTNLTLNDLCVGPDQVIAVGGGRIYQTLHGSIVSNSMFSCIFSSPGGKTWTLRQWAETQTDSGWKQILWSGNQYLAIQGNGDAALSSNGVDWISYQSPELDFAGYSNLPLAGGNGRFLLFQPAVYPGTENFFLVSTDATNWTESLVPPNQSVQDITFADDSFFAVGLDGVVLFSTNGMDWTEQHALSGANLRSPTWTEGGYAALLNPTRVLFSPDGQMWTTFDVVPGINSSFSDSPVVENIYLYGLTGGNGTFVVWGNSRFGGRIILQSDSLLDQPPSMVVQPDDLLLGVGMTHGLSVAATGTAPLHYQWFKDGTELPGVTQQTLPLIDAQLEDSAGYSVMVSNDLGSVTSRLAQVAVSEPWLELSLNHEMRWLEQANQAFPTTLTPHTTIAISGPVGHTWSIQYSDGLDSTNDWQTYPDIYLWKDTLAFVDIFETNSPQRLYRGRLIE